MDIYLLRLHYFVCTHLLLIELIIFCSPSLCEKNSSHLRLSVRNGRIVRNEYKNTDLVYLNK